MFKVNELYTGSYSDYDGIDRSYTFKVIKRTGKNVWLQKVSRTYNGGGAQVWSTEISEPVFRKKLELRANRDGELYELVWLDFFNLYSR